MSRKTICSVVIDTETNCQQPRTCFDCLNVPVDGEDGCFLDTNMGRCMDLISALSLEYPSIYGSDSFKYCNASDAACTECREDTMRNNSMPSVCWGENGCLCSATCEQLGRVSTHNASSSLCDVGQREQIPPPSELLMILLLSFFVCCNFLFAYGVYLRKKKRQRRLHVQQEGPYAKMDAAPSSHLQLTGWFDWRQEMRQQERESSTSTASSSSSASSSNHGVIALEKTNYP